MPDTADIVIVGGGPAGVAAGIMGLSRGLRVVLFEASPEPRLSPGETLHPGIAPILDKLGVLPQVEAAASYRPSAQQIHWGVVTRHDRYGADGRGCWRAYQIARNTLDRLLLERFTDLGGRLVRPSPPLTPLVNGERVVGVVALQDPFLAAVTIDATGRRGFLRRHLALTFRRVSPPLVAHYGYRHGHFGALPMLAGNSEGWRWIAQIDDNLVAWVAMPFVHRKHHSVVPREIACLPQAAPDGAADVTWRLAERVAGPGWFAVGDAACVLDPASAHGVMRAMMSGMLAAHTAAEVINTAAPEVLAQRSYSAWLQSWFQHDVARLLLSYRELGLDWSQAAHQFSAVPRTRRY